MTEDLIAELARQGLGFLLAVIEGIVILFLLRRMDQKEVSLKNRDDIICELQEKRIADFKENSEKIIVIGKDMVNGMSSLKETNQVQTNAITKMIESSRKRVQP